MKAAGKEEQNHRVCCSGKASRGLQKKDDDGHYVHYVHKG